MDINPNKSAYTYINDNSTWKPSHNREVFKILGKESYYKYLGVWINLDLNWTKQKKTSETAYKLAVFTITKKFYLNPSSLVALINVVTTPILAYHM